MRIRRPIAALLTALALFGGGATLTACQAAGDGQSDGTTDDTGDTGQLDEEEADRENLPDNSNPEIGEDQSDGDPD